jgi:hypothetical protein
MNVKSPNNTSKWQMGFNSAFKGLTGEKEFSQFVGIIKPTTNTIPLFDVLQ